MCTVLPFLGGRSVHLGTPLRHTAEMPTRGRGSRDRPMHSTSAQCARGTVVTAATTPAHEEGRLMITKSLPEHTMLESEEARILIEYDDHGHARLDVLAKRYGRGSADAGRLACEAVHQARLRHAASIEGALDASSPLCGAILEALHSEIGHDLESIAMR